MCWVQSMNLTWQRTCKWGHVAMTAVSNRKWCSRPHNPSGDCCEKGTISYLDVVTLLNWTNSYLNGITYGKACSKDWTTKWYVLRWDWTRCSTIMKFHSRSRINTNQEEIVVFTLTFYKFCLSFFISKLATTICKSHDCWFGETIPNSIQRPEKFVKLE